MLRKSQSCPQELELPQRGYWSCPNGRGAAGAADGAPVADTAGAVTYMVMYDVAVDWAIIQTSRSRRSNGRRRRRRYKCRHRNIGRDARNRATS